VSKPEEPKPYDFQCPFCNQKIPLVVAVSREAYKDKPTAVITRTVETIRKSLPTSTLNDLTIEEKEQTFHIKPKKFLGKEAFGMIQKVVKDLGGEWVSQGKTSYWWVPKSEMVEV